MKIVKTNFFSSKRRNPSENYFFFTAVQYNIDCNTNRRHFLFFALSQIKVFFSSLPSFVIPLPFNSSIGLFLS